MTTISRRIKLSEESSALTIHISAPRNYFHILLLPVWCIGWTTGGFALLSGFLTRPLRKDTIFILLWLCLWLASWILLIYSWLWMVFGTEIISIRDSILAIKRDIFGLGRTTRFPVAEVTDFYMISGKPALFSSERSWSRLGFGWGTLGLDWRGRTFKFGLKLRDDEIDLLYDKIVPCLSEASRNSLNGGTG